MNDYQLFSFDKPRKSIREEELIKELRAFSRVNKGKPISKKAYNDWATRRFSPETISRYFGTWENGCKKAQVKFAKKHHYSDEELVEHFEAVWRWREQRPVKKDFQEYNKRHGANVNPVAYSRRWGSLREFGRLFSQYKLNQISFDELIKNKKRQNQREPISPALRAEVLRRDNYKCRDCGANPKNDPKVILHEHHIIPVSKGGKTELSNLETNCDKCNLGKGDKIY